MQPNERRLASLWTPAFCARCDERLEATLSGCGLLCADDDPVHLAPVTWSELLVEGPASLVLLELLDLGVRKLGKLLLLVGVSCCLPPRPLQKRTHPRLCHAAFGLQGRDSVNVDGAPS